MKQINNLALTLTQQMQSQQERTLEVMQLQQEKTLEMMQNGQREMVVKLNALNIGNLQKIMANNHENQASLLAAVQLGSCQMHNVVQ